MDARSRAFVVHRTPQRIRIKIPRWERRDHDFAALQRALERCPGVVCVRVNALVASVVIHCGDGFEITSVRHCFVGLALILPASGRPAGPWARQIAPAQRIHDHSTRAISLVGWVVKLTIAIAMRRPDALIKELILEAAVQALVRQLYRKLMQSPRSEMRPRALLVPAAG
jgi:hypothetical protein